MNDVCKNQTHWALDGSIVIGALTLVAYLFAYFFQVGFLLHFGIPATFIELSLNNIAVTFFGLIPVAYILCFLVIPIEFISRIFPKGIKIISWLKVLGQFLLPYFFMYFFFVYVPYAIAQRWSWPLWLVVTLISITMFIHTYQCYREKNFLKTDSFCTNLCRKFGIKFAWALFCMWLLIVALVMGNQIARLTKNFHMFTSNSQEYAIVYMTSKYAITMPVQPNDMLGMGYVIFPLEEIKTPIALR